MNEITDLIWAHPWVLAFLLVVAGLMWLHEWVWMPMNLFIITPVKWLVRKLVKSRRERIERMDDQELARLQQDQR